MLLVSFLVPIVASLTLEDLFSKPSEHGPSWNQRISDHQAWERATINSSPKNHIITRLVRTNPLNSVKQVKHINLIPQMEHMTQEEAFFVNGDLPHMADEILHVDPENEDDLYARGVETQRVPIKYHEKESERYNPNMDDFIPHESFTPQNSDDIHGGESVQKVPLRIREIEHLHRLEDEYIPHEVFNPKHEDDQYNRMGKKVPKDPFFNYQNYGLPAVGEHQDIAQSINIVQGDDQKESINIVQNEPSMKSINIVFDETAAEMHKQQELYHRYRNQNHFINRDSFRYPQDPQYPILHSGSSDIDAPMRPYDFESYYDGPVPTNPYQTLQDLQFLRVDVRGEIEDPGRTQFKGDSSQEVEAALNENVSDANQGERVEGGELADIEDQPVEGGDAPEDGEAEGGGEAEAGEVAEGADAEGGGDQEEGGDADGGEPKEDAEGGDAEAGDPAEAGDAEGGDAEGGDAKGGDAEGGDAEGGEDQGGDVEGGDAEGGNAYAEGGEIADGGDAAGGDADAENVILDAGEEKQEQEGDSQEKGADEADGGVEGEQVNTDEREDGKKEQEEGAVDANEEDKGNEEERKDTLQHDTHHSHSQDSYQHEATQGIKVIRQAAKRPQNPNKNIDPRFYDPNHPEYDPYNPKNVNQKLYDARFDPRQPAYNANPNFLVLTDQDCEEGQYGPFTEPSIFDILSHPPGEIPFEGPYQDDQYQDGDEENLRGSQDWFTEGNSTSQILRLKSQNGLSQDQLEEMIRRYYEAQQQQSLKMQASKEKQDRLNAEAQQRGDSHFQEQGPQPYQKPRFPRASQAPYEFTPEDEAHSPFTDGPYADYRYSIDPRYAPPDQSVKAKYHPNDPRAFNRVDYRQFKPADEQIDRNRTHQDRDGARGRGKWRGPYGQEDDMRYERSERNGTDPDRDWEDYYDEDEDGFFAGRRRPIRDRFEDRDGDGYDDRTGRSYDDPYGDRYGEPYDDRYGGPYGSRYGGRYGRYRNRDKDRNYEPYDLERRYPKNDYYYGRSSDRYHRRYRHERDRRPYSWENSHTRKGQLHPSKNHTVEEFHIYRDLNTYKQERDLYDKRPRDVKARDQGAELDNLQGKRVLIRSLDDDDEYYHPKNKNETERFDTAGRAFTKTLKAQQKEREDKEASQKHLEERGIVKPKKQKKQAKKPGRKKAKDETAKRQRGQQPPSRERNETTSAARNETLPAERNETVPLDRNETAPIDRNVTDTARRNDSADSQEYGVQGLAASKSNNVGDTASLEKPQNNKTTRREMSKANELDEPEPNLKYQARGNSEKAQENQEMGQEEPLLNKNKASKMMIQLPDYSCKDPQGRAKLFSCNQCNASRIYVLNDDTWYLVGLAKGYKREFHKTFKALKQFLNPSLVYTSFSKNNSICFSTDNHQEVNITRFFNQFLEIEIRSTLLRLPDSFDLNYLQMQYRNGQILDFVIEAENRTEIRLGGLQIHRILYYYLQEMNGTQLNYLGSFKFGSIERNFEYEIRGVNNSTNSETLRIFLDLPNDLQFISQVSSQLLSNQYNLMLIDYLSKKIPLVQNSKMGIVTIKIKTEIDYQEVSINLKH